MKIIDCQQRSEEWLEARRGIPTASNFGKIVTGKGDQSKQREGYLNTLAAERITGIVEESFVSNIMLKAMEREDSARWIYAMYNRVEVEEVGFCLDDSGRWGASPDGLIGEEGLVEVKCPIGKTATEYLRSGKMPPIYYQQTQGQLLVTGREWVDFVSYYAKLPLLVVRVERDEGFLAKLESELMLFCSELDRICEDLGEKK